MLRLKTGHILCTNSQWGASLQKMLIDNRTWTSLFLVSIFSPSLQASESRMHLKFQQPYRLQDTIFGNKGNWRTVSHKLKQRKSGQNSAQEFQTFCWEAASGLTNSKEGQCTLPDLMKRGGDPGRRKREPCLGNALPSIQKNAKLKKGPGMKWKL